MSRKDGEKGLEKAENGEKSKFRHARTRSASAEGEKQG